MISLDQVKLLESKVTRAIDHVKKVTEENAFLKGKLDSYQKRVDELEILVQQFKDEQSRIEDGILSALDRLNQFEDALEKTLAAEKAEGVAPPKEDALPAGAENSTESIPPEEKADAKDAGAKDADTEKPAEVSSDASGEKNAGSSKKESKKPAAAKQPEADNGQSADSPQEPPVGESQKEGPWPSEELDIF